MVGKPKSCTACRQAKMGCDARIKAPSPCSRCESNKLECCFVKNFKRVSTRKIARDIANELHIARDSQNPDGQSPPLPDCQSATFSAPGARAPFLLSTDMEDSSNFCLGELSVSPEVAMELLRHFERHYYPYATFIAPVQSLTRFASDSALLFWTIVLIASQYHHKHSHLYEDLFFPHQELLAPLSYVAVRSMENVHATLLLCLWPIPRRRVLHDPSWTYVGIAVNSCMAFDCHKPPAQIHIVPGRAKLSGGVDVPTKCLTWLACFSIGTQIAAFLGFAPPISSFPQLKHVRKAVDQLNGLLSHENRASLAICEIVCNYSVSLEDVEDQGAHISLTNAFDGSLDTIKQTYLAHWTPELDIQLQIAKLNLYAASALLRFQRNSLTDTQHLINREALFLRGLESAMTLIKHMKNMAVSSYCEGQYPAGKLTFLPMHFFTSLFFCTAFLFRIFVYHQPLGHTHTTRAIQGMLDAQSIFQLLPLHRGFARAAMLIGKFVEKAEPTDPAGSHSLLPELIITNRLGASVLWDTFAQMRLNANPERSNGGRGNTKKRRIVGLDPLPPAPEMKRRIQKCREELIRIPIAEEQEANSWAFGDIDLDGFGFDFNQQIL